MYRIKTPCPRCGKQKKIRTYCEMTDEYIKVIVRNGCFSCGWRPPRKYYFRTWGPPRSNGVVAQLVSGSYPLDPSALSSVVRAPV